MYFSGTRFLPVLFQFSVLSTVIVGSIFAQTAQKPSPASIHYLPATKETYLKLTEEMDATLDRDILKPWFPRALDNDHGGFRSNFDSEWKPFGKESKFSVFQGRMTWVASKIVERRPDLKQQYEPYVKRGVDYLTGTLWDKENGGFYWGLSEDGEISPFYTDGKQLYGMSFAIYGLAAAYRATKDPRALEYAQKGFRWIEEHAHDAKNGGYFEYLTRDGQPFQAHPGNRNRQTNAGVTIPCWLQIHEHAHSFAGVLLAALRSLERRSASSATRGASGHHSR